METLWRDLRYGFRMLRRNPGFTAIAVVSLALGIGANTAIFSVVNAVLLKGLPFIDPERLVMVWEDASFAGFPRNTPAPANYDDWKSRSDVFEDMAALSERSFNLTGDGEPERIVAYAATGSFFSLLGVEPVLGRTILPDDDSPEANKVVVLSHRLWQQRYGGDESIIGRDVLLSGEKYTIVGVMPARFQFLGSYITAWIPMAFTPSQLAQRGNHYLEVVARMKAGVSPEQANAQIQTIQRQIGQDHPDEAGRLSAYVMPLRDQVAGDIRRPLLVLFGAVGFVLLIACANIANLLLSRAASRQREIAVRAALGASRWRIIRQLITEGVVLSTAGALLGILLAVQSLTYLSRLIPDTLAVSTNLSLDLQVLGYTLLVSLATSIIFGLAPAVQAAKVDLNEALKQSGGRSGLSAGGNRLRSAMVVAEVALALVLLVGAGLLIQTFVNLSTQYSTLRPENVLILRTDLPSSKYADQPHRAGFYSQALARVKALPGVVSAGYVTTVPLAWKGGTSGFYPEGLTLDQARAGGLSYDANHRQVSDDYLKTMGIPLRQGRFFGDGDNELALPVAIVNETMARQYWPGDAIGKRFKLGDPEDAIPWITVVGVCGDIRQMGADEPVKAEMYLPYRQITDHQWFAPHDLVLRSSIPPLSLVAAVRNEIREIDPDQPISNIRTMDDLIGAETGTRRLGMTLLTVFAALALLLAALGIYGVLAYFVVQHTPEIGVRVALGAPRSGILALVLKKGMTLALLGVATGLGAAFALTRLMASLLFGMSATDPGTFVMVALLLIAVAFIACYLPARRATKVDPMIALRYE
jgi:putative ABC transport system permease protein